MVIDAEDHLFIRVSHPADRQLQVHAGIAQHDAEGVTEIMGPDGPLFPVHEAERIRFFFSAAGKKVLNLVIAAGIPLTIGRFQEIPAALFAVIQHQFNLILPVVPGVLKGRFRAEPAAGVRKDQTGKIFHERTQGIEKRDIPLAGFRFRIAEDGPV